MSPLRHRDDSVMIGLDIAEASHATDLLDSAVNFVYCCATSFLRDKAASIAAEALTVAA